MADVLDPASLVDAAQQAAAAGDFSRAEQLLRDAAARQEAELGSAHPDLATTLNNLAFVCERLEKVADAERGYRRAHAIAVASLSPGHPLIKTSLTNLLEFCAAHGIPVWAPKANPAAASIEPDDEPLEDEAHAEHDAKLERERGSESEPVPPVLAAPAVVNSRMMPRTVAVAALGVAAIVIVMFTRQSMGKTETETTAAPAPVSSEVSSTSAPAPTTSAPAPSPVARRETTPAVPRETTPDALPELRAAATPRSGAPSRSGATPRSDGSIAVLAAQVCSTLERRGSPDWHCAAVGGDVPPGRYVFYTRVRAASAATLEHRWYAGERLHQTTTLRVPASTGNGYRTFSSSRVSPERAGDWKVELRTSDGALLDEARFVVR